MTTDEIMALAINYADERVMGTMGRSTGQDVAAAHAALRSAVEALVADAERYRWLREHGDRDCTQKDGYGGYELRMGEELDAVVDEARSKV